MNAISIHRFMLGERQVQLPDRPELYELTELTIDKTMQTYLVEDPQRFGGQSNTPLGTYEIQELVRTRVTMTVQDSSGKGWHLQVPPGIYRIEDGIIRVPEGTAYRLTPAPST